MSSAQDVQHVVVRTCAELGLPTVLFNNAGVDPENKLSILSISEAGVLGRMAEPEEMARDERHFGAGAGATVIPTSASLCSRRRVLCWPHDYETPHRPRHL